jgi:Glycosyltransferase
MRERVRQYESGHCRVHVMPPWPLDEVVTPLTHDENPFRATHDLNGKFVVMYSGNLGIHALDTLVDAAAELEHDPDVVFLFVGDGVAKEAVERRRLRNVKTLPYQPRSALRESLSGADLHAVALGNDVVGINHPCKIYGAMAVGRPILYIGPRESHIGDILGAQEIGWHVEHGDVAGVKGAIAEARSLTRDRWTAMGSAAQDAVERQFGRGYLTRQFCDVVTGALPRR